MTERLVYHEGMSVETFCQQPQEIHCEMLLPYDLAPDTDPITQRKALEKILGGRVRSIYGTRRLPNIRAHWIRFKWERDPNPETT